MSEVVSLNVDPAMIRGIVEKEIKAAIVAQLGKAPNLIEAVVQNALKTKTDSTGRVSSSNYENRYDMIEALCCMAVSECAQQAVREWVAEAKPRIVASLKKQLESKKSDIVKRFVDAAEKSIIPTMSVSCSLAPLPDRY